MTKRNLFPKINSENYNKPRSAQELEQTIVEAQYPISPAFVELKTQGGIVNPEPRQLCYPDSPEVKPNDIRYVNGLTFVSLLSVLSLVGVAIYFNLTRDKDSKKTKKGKEKKSIVLISYDFIKPGDLVYVTRDLPKLGLLQGQIGTVISSETIFCHSINFDADSKFVDLKKFFKISLQKYSSEILCIDSKFA